MAEKRGQGERKRPRSAPSNTSSTVSADSDRNRTPSFGTQGRSTLGATDTTDSNDGDKALFTKPSSSNTKSLVQPSRQRLASAITSVSSSLSDTSAPAGDSFTNMGPVHGKQLPSIKLDGYTDINGICLYNGLALYSAWSVEHELPVILMTPIKYSLEIVSRLRHEYEVCTTDLRNVAGVTKCLAIENARHGIYFVIDNSIRCISLRDYYSTENWKIDDFLRHAIRISEIVAEVHGASIIHKNLNPDTIVLGTGEHEGQVMVSDYTICSRLQSENVQNRRDIRSLEGRFAYMAPESTGRMNRSVDNRVDMYSLGITFYEILTGRLPFDSPDPLTLIHQHIAQPATPPNQRNKQLPKSVNDIILKLMAKSADRRYHSIWGLKADLEALLSLYEKASEEERRTDWDKDFVVGTKDLASKFAIPQRLFGRKSETELLLKCFKNVQSKGGSQLILVRGYSGGMCCL